MIERGHKYAVKTCPQLLNPEWKSREKDITALKWLHHMIDENGLAGEAILKQVWSCNPYWAKRGFKEYQMPCVAEVQIESMTGKAAVELINNKV